MYPRQESSIQVTLLLGRGSGGQRVCFLETDSIFFVTLPLLAEPNIILCLLEVFTHMCLVLGKCIARYCSAPCTTCHYRRSPSCRLPPHQHPLVDTHSERALSAVIPQLLCLCASLQENVCKMSFEQCSNRLLSKGCDIQEPAVSHKVRACFRVVFDVHISLLDNTLNPSCSSAPIFSVAKTHLYTDLRLCRQQSASPEYFCAPQ
jgi:hypothetical protein